MAVMKKSPKHGSSSMDMATERALQEKALQNNGCYAEEP